MNKTLVLTFQAPDRPGLVEEIADVVRSNHGNWLESRLVKLAGQFAGIVRVEIASEYYQASCDALLALNSDKLALSIATANSLDAPEQALRQCHLHIVGNDRPGIVLEVGRALKQQEINVLEMESNITSAAMSGEPLFEAEVRAEAPPSSDLSELEESLDNISEMLSIDIVLR